MLGAVWSILCEAVPAFGKLTFGWKRVVIFALCLGMPFAALLFGVCVLACPDMALNGQTIGTALLTGGWAFTTSQGVHTLIKTLRES